MKTGQRESQGSSALLLSLSLSLSLSLEETLQCVSENRPCVIQHINSHLVSHLVNQLVSHSASQARQSTIQPSTLVVHLSVPLSSAAAPSNPVSPPLTDARHHPCSRSKLLRCLTVRLSPWNPPQSFFFFFRPVQREDLSVAVEAPLN